MKEFFKKCCRTLVQLFSFSLLVLSLDGAIRFYERSDTRWYKDEVVQTRTVEFNTTFRLTLESKTKEKIATSIPETKDQKIEKKVQPH